jgi:hypothetical protein
VLACVHKEMWFLLKMNADLDSDESNTSDKGGSDIYMRKENEQ